MSALPAFARGNPCPPDDDFSDVRWQEACDAHGKHLAAEDYLAELVELLADPTLGCALSAASNGRPLQYCEVAAIKKLHRACWQMRDAVQAEYDELGNDDE